jgi:hypothetical protein
VITLDDAKRWLRERFAAGADCPCCGQHVKLYKRPLNASMAYVLLMLYRDATVGRQWVHMPSFIAHQTKDNPRMAAAVRGDWAKLRFWGLLEAERDAERPDGSDRVGHYRITDLGRQFCEDRVAVPAYVYLFNERIVTAPILREYGITPDASVIRISEALGKKFDYRELMQPCPS